MTKIYTCVATEAAEKNRLEKQRIIIIANEPKYILSNISIAVKNDM
jgi:hypothetical protein